VQPKLLASYFTFAGDVIPLQSDAPSPFDFRDRVEAASRAGFTSMGIFHDDIPHVVGRYGYPGVRALLADNGIERLELEAMIDWFADGERRERSDRTRNLLLHAAEALNAYQIKVVGDGMGNWPLTAMTEAFGVLADQAGDRGTRLSIEVMAGSNIATLRRALELLNGADRPNTGVMLDIWHLVRGGIPYEEVAALPKARILGVELNDGLLASEGTAFEDTVFRRRFCGEGEFDIDGFVGAVNATGYDGPFGVEVLSDAVRAMPLDVVARRAFVTTRSMFA
jgi:sugar phosphate isomerase/epimerase